MDGTPADSSRTEGPNTQDLEEIVVRDTVVKDMYVRWQPSIGNDAAW